MSRRRRKEKEQEEEEKEKGEERISRRREMRKKEKEQKEEQKEQNTEMGFLMISIVQRSWRLIKISCGSPIQQPKNGPSLVH
jgi:hypothetical protein